MDNKNINKIIFIKRKAIYNQYYLFLIIIAYLLKISLANSINIKTFRNLNNYISEIHLVIKGKGNQQILYNKFYTEPSEVIEMEFLKIYHVEKNVN